MATVTRLAFSAPRVTSVIRNTCKMNHNIFTKVNWLEAEFIIRIVEGLEAVTLNINTTAGFTNYVCDIIKNNEFASLNGKSSRGRRSCQRVNDY